MSRVVQSLRPATGTSTPRQHPGLAALLGYARQGDAIVVIGMVAGVLASLAERELGLGRDRGSAARRARGQAHWGRIRCARAALEASKVLGEACDE
jgi:hypothetical protein